MDCSVRYQVRHDSGSDFDVLLTVINHGDHTITGWRMDFAYPGSQRLTATPSGVTQRGRRVVLRGRSNTKLVPGRAITYALRGGYRTVNPLPFVFTLDGHPCRSEVLGATGLG